MSLVERCWMITSKFSVIAILIITGICFGVFVYPYMKKKREAEQILAAIAKRDAWIMDATECLVRQFRR